MELLHIDGDYRLGSIERKILTKIDLELSHSNRDFECLIKVEKNGVFKIDFSSVKRELHLNFFSRREFINGLIDLRDLIQRANQK